MNYEIHANKIGKPYLKKVDGPRRVSETGRGVWVPIGRPTDSGIEKVIRTNQIAGLLVLIDDDNNYRALVLTD